jgi:hypothetical protein
MNVLVVTTTIPDIYKHKAYIVHPVDYISIALKKTQQMMFLTQPYLLHEANQVSLKP